MHATGPKAGVAPPLTRDPRDAHLRETMPAYLVAGKYLLGVLMEEIRANTTPEVFDTFDSTESIVNAFRRQLAAYTYQEPPFIYMPGPDMVEPRVYWKGLIANTDVSVLAVSIHLFYFESRSIDSHLIGSWTQIIFSCAKLNG
jgi:hypothetical protein